MRAAYIQEPQEWVAGFSFSTTVKVRFSETDMYGHVNNTKVFAYLEYARIEYFKALGFDFSNDSGNQNMLVVADIQCDYLNQVFFDETLTIYVKTASIGNSSMDLHYLVKNEKGDICYTARGTLVQLNYSTGKGVPFLEEQKKLLLGK
ncbi:thioesterase family protein [Solibacillus sp. FSL R7-0668]|uniref:acyl-CoA thioesterase n=1 Tax=Solibacillus sp. FSL R7-0668 TaxID=2921688 RepID=UPI0030F5A0AA